jgi:hypothetical protein
MTGHFLHDSGRAALPRRPEIGDARQRVPTGHGLLSNLFR